MIDDEEAEVVFATLQRVLELKKQFEQLQQQQQQYQQRLILPSLSSSSSPSSTSISAPTPSLSMRQSIDSFFSTFYSPIIRYNQLFWKADVCWCVTRFDGAFLACNDQMFTVTNHTRNDLAQGRMSAIAPTEPSSMQVAMAAFNHAIHYGSSPAPQFYTRSHNGNRLRVTWGYLWTINTSESSVPGGKALSILVSLQEVKEDEHQMSCEAEVEEIIGSAATTDTAMLSTTQLSPSTPMTLSLSPSQPPTPPPLLSHPPSLSGTTSSSLFSSESQPQQSQPQPEHFESSELISTRAAKRYRNEDPPPP